MSSYRNYDPDTLNKLHQVELEILDKFNEICQKNNINYSLCGGTLLGAIRHKGFIPWDDDIDVIMPRKDYEKFLEIGQQELGDKYYLDSFKTNKKGYLPFSKIRKNGTIFDEELSHHIDCHKGIFIDIFPLDNVKDMKKSHTTAGFIKSIINAINVKVKIFKLKDARHKILVWFLTLFSTKKLMSFIDKLAKKENDVDTEYLVCFVGSYSFKSELIKKSDFFPTKLTSFEGKKYSIMNNYENYLSGLYGNYMELPPVEKRINHMPLNIDFGDKK